MNGRTDRQTDRQNCNNYIVLCIASRMEAPWKWNMIIKNSVHYKQ